MKQRQLAGFRSAEIVFGLGLRAAVRRAKTGREDFVHRAAREIENARLDARLDLRFAVNRDDRWQLRQVAMVNDLE